MLQLTAFNHFLAPGDRMSILRLDGDAATCRCHISIIPLSDKIHINELSALNGAAGIPEFFFTPTSSLLASQWHPSMIPLYFPGHPMTFNGSPYCPLPYSLRLPPTCHACHENFSGNGAHGKRAGRISHPKRPGGQVYIKCIFRDWLRIRAIVSQASFILVKHEVC